MDNTNNKTEVFCASCGAKMPAGTKFCVACGKPVGAPAAPNPNMAQQQAVYAPQAAPMPKTKFGITVGLFAAAIYFAAIFGGYVPVLLLGGYALIAEKDGWLKRVAIKAVAILMDGGRVKADTSTYQNDMTSFQGKDDILSLLIHLGYLGFDNERDEVFIPNREIMDEFRTSTKGSEWVDTFELFELSRKLLKATWEMKPDVVAELIEKAHDRAGNKTYHDETALSYSIQLAYYAAQKYYTTILELDSGKGYADIVYLPSPEYPDKPALLIELKYNKTADTALNQIKRREYPARLEHYKGNILLVGINYDPEAQNIDPDFKHHSCVIEKV